MRKKHRKRRSDPPPAVPSTSEPVVPGQATELEAAAREVAGQHSVPAPEAPTSPPPELPATEGGGLVDVVEELAEQPAGALSQRLAAMTEEDIAAVVELGFGLVSEIRGPHWEIEERQSRRIAKWIRRSIERHGGVPAWLEQWLPDVMVAALLGQAIWVRVAKDRQLAGAKRESLSVVP